MTGVPDLTALFSPPERTLPVMLRRQAERYGDRVLLRAGGVEWSYSRACAIAARAAGRLAAAGIGQGDRVAIICSNRAEFLEAFLGCAWSGVIAVPINTASRGLQLQHVLSNSGARLLIIEGDSLDVLDHIDFSTLPLEQLWLIGETGEVPNRLPQSAPLPPLGEALPPAAIRPGDTLAILYTSGTTGPSKGVCCPQAQYFWWGVNTSRLLGVREGDVLCTPLPLFHTNALNTFYQAFLNGSTMVAEKRFSASGFFRALAESKATVTYLLGAMVPILLSREPAAEERAHQVRIALAPGVPGHFHAAFIARTGIRLLDGYGSTETNHVIGTAIDEQLPGLMGRIYPGFEGRVVDAEDNSVPDGQAGELILRAAEPFAFATGYWGMPEKTVEAWRNLWFHTGDQVIRDADGYYKFVDRIKEAIRRRGENISSYEVEEVLLSHKEIATAAVFPVRSELAEDEVMAAIVRTPGSRLGAVELMDFCAPRLPYFAVPRYVEFVAELPATESGKIQKFKLRERGITSATWDREAAGYKLKR
ncbi:MAG TPA: ATP-dependent acyl-CoA ligase [Stellaceae bacterium]|nr:ATP-dependent acyl-CoA ligase [Stellaceae bacterium]